MKKHLIVCNIYISKSVYICAHACISVCVCVHTEVEEENSLSWRR